MHFPLEKRGRWLRNFPTRRSQRQPGGKTNTEPGHGCHSPAGRQGRPGTREGKGPEVLKSLILKATIESLRWKAFVCGFLFLLFFFLMWTVSKVFTEPVMTTSIHTWASRLWGIWDLSSLPRDPTCTPTYGISALWPGIQPVPHIRDLSSLTRDATCTPTFGKQSPDYWTASRVQKTLSFKIITIIGTYSLSFTCQADGTCRKVGSLIFKNSPSSPIVWDQTF